MIKIETHPTESPLTGQSKWWGEPDMPEEFDWRSCLVHYPVQQLRTRAERHPAGAHQAA